MDKDYGSLLQIYGDLARELAKEVPAQLRRKDLTAGEAGALFNKVNEPAMAVESILAELEDADDEIWIEAAKPLASLYEALAEAMAAKIADLRDVET